MNLNFFNEVESEVSTEQIDKIKIAAAEGIAEAQYYLALMFDSGNPIERNPNEAVKWYNEAAKQGHANAQYFLARMYSSQTSGIEQNLDIAYELYRKAANQGHPEARKKIKALKEES